MATKRTKSNRADARWYAKPDEPHEAIRAVVDKLLKNGHRSELHLWRNLYLDRQHTDYKRRGIYRPGQRARFNVIRNSVETMQARIAKDLARPLIATTGAGFKMQRKAKGMQRFLDGDWERLGADKFRRQQVLDACIYGEGVIKVFSEQGRVAWRRVWCGDLLRHPREEAAGHVRTLYEIACVDKGVLAEIWPESRKTILDLPAPPNEVVDDPDDDDDLVLVIEAWRLPNGVDDNGDPVGGRHSIVVDGDTLMDDSWDRDRFPFSRLPYSVDPATGRGIGIPERMAGAQSEQNSIAELVSDIARIMTPKIVLPSGSKLTVDQLSNDIEVWETNGEMPQILEANPAILGAMQYALMQRESAYREQGIDTYAAESSKPADLSSGKAAVVHRDINAERHVIFAQENEQATIDLATLHIETCEEIAEDDASLLVAHAGKGTLDQVKWTEVSLGDNPFVIRVKPVSRLSDSPDGKLAQLGEMQTRGWISTDEARELFDLPDIERSNDLAFARRDLSRKLIESALDGNAAAPTEVCDLVYLIETGTQQYAYAQTQGASEDELVPLLDLIGAAQGIIDQKAAEEAAKAPPPAPSSPQMPMMPMGGPAGPPPTMPPAVPEVPPEMGAGMPL